VTPATFHHTALCFTSAPAAGVSSVAVSRLVIGPHHAEKYGLEASATTTSTSTTASQALDLVTLPGGEVPSHAIMR
jgi:hypothetical protein